MARDAVDACVHGLGRSVPPSCTHDVPLLGADGFAALWNRRRVLATESGLHVARVEHLLGRYGTLVTEVLDLIRADPSLAGPLDGAEDYLRAEIVYGADHEGARHLEDMLTRRTRISIETFDRGVAAAPVAASLMAGVLGWTSEQTAREVERYHLRVKAERSSQEQPDDETADAARLGAPDVVPLSGS
ncbi:glycerol-3-phosphate dehydrogenase C-terminal domain-containing protein [Paractinoplanes durhamensis]